MYTIISINRKRSNPRGYTPALSTMHVARVRAEAWLAAMTGLALWHARAHKLVPEAEPRCMMHDLGEAMLNVF